MHTFPSDSDYAQLKGFKDGLCVSLYMSMTDIEPNVRAIRIKLKNQIKDIHNVLTMNGVAHRNVGQWTEPLGGIISSREMLDIKPDTTLAFFLHPMMFRWFKLPQSDVEDTIVVQNHFYLDYIDDLMEHNRNYFVLLLGHKDVRLLKGNMLGMQGVDLGNFKKDMREALGIDEYPRVTEKHMVAPAGHSGSEGTHSQYDAKQVDKELLIRFFRMLDKHIQPLLRKENYPLILAGVTYLLPIYQKVTTYPNIVTQHIIGNQSHTNTKELQTKAIHLMGA